MKFCRVIPIDKIDKSTLTVRTTPRGDAILTGMLQGVEGETTVAIKFSDKISPSSAEQVCNSFSGELFDEIVQGFGDVGITNSDMTVEEFEQLCGFESTEEVTLSEELSLSGAVYEATLLQAGESLSFGENGKPTVFTDEVLKSAADRKVFEGIPVRAYRTGNFFVHLQQVNPELAAKFPDGLPEAKIGKIVNAVWDATKRAVVGKVVLEDTPQATLMDKVLQAAQQALGTLSNFMGLSVVIDVRRKAGQIMEIIQSEGIDVVSVPAGGGHFETVLNGLSFTEPNTTKEAVKMEKLIQYIMSLDSSVGDLAGKTEDELLKILQGIMAKKESDLEAAKKSATATVSEIEGLKAGFASMQDSMKKMLEETQRGQLKLSAEARINQSALPSASKSKLIMGLNNQNDLSDTAVGAMIKAEADYLDSLKSDGFVNLASNIEVGADHWDKVKEAFAAGLDIKDAKREFGVLSLQQFYKESTGDWALRNKIDVKKVGMGVMSTADFANALANVLYRRLSQAFMEMDYGQDVLITDYRTATDFKTMQTSNTGGFATMPVVGELEPYTEVTMPTDWKSTYAVKKYGQLMPVSWESILNDDIGLLRRLIDKFGAAMKRTYAAHVYTLMTSNPAVPDSGDTLFHANHGNTGTTAFSLTELDVVKLAMYNQTEPGSAVKLGFRPQHIFISSHLETEVKKANMAEYLDSSFTPNVYRFVFGQNNERIHVVPFWTDDHDWYIMGDPAQCPFIEMAHLNGNKTPELFLQDTPTVDSVFTSEKITYKIRFVFQGKVIEYRNVYRESVT